MSRCCQPYSGAAGPTVTGCGPPLPSFVQPAGTIYFDTSDPANPIKYVYAGTWQVVSGNAIARQLFADFAAGTYLYNETTPTTLAANFVNFVGGAPSGTPITDAAGVECLLASPAPPAGSSPCFTDPLLTGPPDAMGTQLQGLTAPTGFFLIEEFTIDVYDNTDPACWRLFSFQDNLFGSMQSLWWVPVGGSMPDGSGISPYTYPIIVWMYNTGGGVVQIIQPGAVVGQVNQVAALFLQCRQQPNNGLLVLSTNGAPIQTNQLGITMVQPWQYSLNGGQGAISPGANPIAHIRQLGVYTPNVPFSHYPTLSTPGTPAPASVTP